MGSTARVLGAAQTSMAGRTLPVAELARRAALAALADAGLDPSEVGLVLFTNALGGSVDQEMVRGQSWLAPLGLGGVPVINVENACAGSVSALSLALRIAPTEVVLVVAADTMRHDDREVVAPLLLQGIAAEDRAAMAAAAGDLAPLMAHNAQRAAHLLHRGLATEADLAAVVVKSSALASANPIARGTTPLTLEQVLGARVVAPPLTRPMCCSYTDGAAAVVLGPPGRGAGPVLRAVELRSGDGTAPWFGRFAELAEGAWAAAGVGPADVSVAELHDVTAAEELESLEALGIYGPGEAGAATSSGATGVAGPGPAVNPSGGLLGRGHPLAATGLAQVVEVADQLRGRARSRQVAGAEVGIAVNMGGIVGTEPALVGLAVLTRT